MPKALGGPRRGGGHRRSARKKRRTLKVKDIKESGEQIAGLTALDSSSETERRPSSDSTIFGHQPGLKNPVSSDMPAFISKPIFGSVSRIPQGAFDADKLAVYFWQSPHPKTFLNLSASQKAWKERVDQEDAMIDFDDGADDWCEISGNPVDYIDHRRNGLAVEYRVASTFIKRAKRAFRAGKTWEEFELDERTIDSGSKAGEPDFWRAEPLIEQPLDNNLRLAVFDMLKPRLCEEIWLRPYQAPAANAEPPAPVVQPPISVADAVATIVAAAPSISTTQNVTAQQAAKPEGPEHKVEKRRSKRQRLLQPPNTSKAPAAHNRQDSLAEVKGPARRESNAQTPSGSNATHAAKATAKAPTAKDMTASAVAASVGNVDAVGTIMFGTSAAALALREPDFETSDEGEE